MYRNGEKYRQYCIHTKMLYIYIYATRDGGKPKPYAVRSVHVFLIDFEDFAAVI